MRWLQLQFDIRFELDTIFRQHIGVVLGFAVMLHFVCKRTVSFLFTRWRPFNRHTSAKTSPRISGPVRSPMDPWECISGDE